jgi:4'-phosphopantetheinyl transferase
VAHSAGLVVCALGRGREVGVDVEDLLRRPVERAVVEHYCGAAEVADIDARGPAWYERFLHHWTLKEAYLKARGLGISMPLAEIGFALDGAAPRVAFSGSLAGTDDRWAFVIARPTDRHLMAIAASTTDGSAPRVTIQPLPDELLA